MKAKDITFKSICFVIMAIAFLSVTDAKASSHQDAPLLRNDPSYTPPIYVKEGEKVIASMFLPDNRREDFDLQFHLSCSDQFDFEVKIINIENPDEPIDTEFISLGLSDSGNPAGAVVEFNINFTGAISLIIKPLDSRINNGSKGNGECSKQELIGSIQVMNPNGCSQITYQFHRILVSGHSTSGSADGG